MKLYYFKAEHGNFGDDLNPWLWSRLLGEGFFEEDSDELFVGIGTLLNHRIPRARRTFVFGSGHGYGSRPAIDDSWEFICVRGPKTAAALGLPPSAALTDPAILIHAYTREAIRPVPGRVAYLPHCDSAEYGEWDDIARRAGLHYIDPRWSVDRVIAEIGQCQHIVTEAMHGAIFADAMRVPWTAAVAYPHISAFKWEDWCLSLDMQYAPHTLGAIWRGDAGLVWSQRLKNAVKRSLLRLGASDHGWTTPPPPRSSERARDQVAAALAGLARLPPTLSADSTHESRIAQLHERLARVKQLAGR